MSTLDYQVGGSLSPDASSYVERDADTELYDAIFRGEYCLVLNPRQVGKSSLRVRVMQKLQRKGFACAAMEMGTIGAKGVTPDRWFGSVTQTLITSLGFGDRFNLRPWWMERRELLSASKWFEVFLGDVLLREVQGNVVIFLDEIDYLLNVEFKKDIFSLIRSCYNARPDKPEFRRLSFVLIGVATPTDLMGYDKDIQSTPFNIGCSIELRGFRREEARGLAGGLAKVAANPQRMLDAIFEWSGGQPFLTQRLCKLVCEGEGVIANGMEVQYVGEVVRRRVIENWEAPEKDELEHLKTIRDRVLSTDVAVWMLGQYQRILEVGWVAAENSQHEVWLRLTGLVVKQEGRLRVYNPIYESIFDLEWVKAQLVNIAPYGAALRAWVGAGKDDAFLLKGEALGKALAWAEGRRLRVEDDGFLNASQDVEKRGLMAERQKAEVELEAANLQLKQVTQQAEAEQEVANQELEQVTQETNKLLRQGQRARLMTSVIAAGAVIAAGVASLFAYQATGKLNKANEGTQRAENAKVQAENAKVRLDKELGKALAEKDKVVKEARNILTKANKNVADAKQKAQLAQQQVGRANVQLRQVNQSKNQAEREKIAAEQANTIAQQNLQSANAQLQVALAERQKATAEVAQAQETLVIAKAVAQLEQRGSRALDVFKRDQSEGLLMALEAGQELQRLLTQSKKSSSGERILAGYLTLSPYRAINEILMNIQERFISTGDLIDEISWNGDGSILAMLESYTGTVKLRKLDGSLISEVRPEQGKFLNISWNPCRNILAASVDNGKVQLWKHNGSLVSEFRPGQDKFFRMTWSPNCNTLATLGGDSGTVKLWRVDGSLINEFRSGQGKFESISWNANNNTFATGGADGTVKLWEQNGSLINEIKTVQHTVDSISWSPDGNILATGEMGRIVKLWKRDGTLIREITIGKTEQYQYDQYDIIRMSWSSDSNTLAMKGISGRLIREDNGSGSLKLWQRDKNQIKEINSVQGKVTSMSWDTNDNILATGGDGLVKLWSQDGNLVNEIKMDNHYDSVYVSWNPNGNTLATGSKGTIRLWKQDGSPINEIQTRQRRTMKVSWNADDNTFATGGADGTVKIWKREGILMHQFQTGQGIIAYLSWSPDGKTLATSGNTGVVRLWQRDGKPINEIKTEITYVDHDIGYIAPLSWSPDNNTLATIGKETGVMLWNRDGTPITTLKTEQSTIANSISWNPADNTLTTGGGDGIVRLWKRDGTLVRKVETGISVGQVSWSPDGNIFTIDRNDGTVELWKRDGSKITKFETMQGWIVISWNANGNTFATGGYNGTVKLWKRDGTLITEMTTDQGNIVDVSWSKKENTLAIAGSNGTLKLWTFENLDSVLERSCNWLNFYLIYKPKELQKLTVCQTPDRVRAAAPNLVEDSEQLAKEGRVDEAIQGFKVAQQWNPRLIFDPVAKANQLAQEAKKKE